MVVIELGGEQVPYDKLTINIKRKFVNISAYIDGCGQTFIIEKKKLREALK